jgi:5-methylcytosine-specific restriction enzyme subunit McrC
MHSAAPVRTLTLTERVPRVCRLAPADVRFLLAEHRAHLRLMPTGRRDRYRLTALGHVGVVVAPTCRLVIRPKVPLANLFFLLDPLAPVAAASDAVAPEPGTEALAFLAGQLARKLAERAVAGLHRAYRERTEQGPFLHGTLDLPAQLREDPGRKDRLHGRFDDLTTDLPCNQLPRAVTERLLASPLLPETVRAALRQAMPVFDGVEIVPLTADLCAAAERAPEGYRPLLDLCRLLADGLAPGENAGPTPAPAFLLDLERVFEGYVTRGVVEAFAGRSAHTVSIQPAHRITPALTGQPEITVRPDVVIDGEDGSVLIVDAKWKRLPKAGPVTADLYQMLAYCTALGVRRAALVYAGRRDGAWAYPLSRAPVVIEVRTLRVVGGPEECRRSLRRLGRALRLAVRA